MTVMFPIEFLAKQVYDPSLSNVVSGNFRMLAAIIMVFGEVTFPSYHVILGWGLPSTGQ